MLKTVLCLCLLIPFMVNGAVQIPEHVTKFIDAHKQMADEYREELTGHLTKGDICAAEMLEILDACLTHVNDNGFYHEIDDTVTEKHTTRTTNQGQIGKKNKQSYRPEIRELLHRMVHNKGDEALRLMVIGNLAYELEVAKLVKLKSALQPHHLVIGPLITSTFEAELNAERMYINEMPETAEAALFFIGKEIDVTSKCPLRRKTPGGDINEAHLFREEIRKVIMKVVGINNKAKDKYLQAIAAEAHDEAETQLKNMENDLEQKSNLVALIAWQGNI